MSEDLPFGAGSLAVNVGGDIGTLIYAQGNVGTSTSVGTTT